MYELNVVTRAFISTHVAIPSTQCGGFKLDAVLVNKQKLMHTTENRVISVNNGYI